MWSSAGGRILRGGDVVKKSGFDRLNHRGFYSTSFFLYHCPLKDRALAGCGRSDGFAGTPVVDFC